MRGWEDRGKLVWMKRERSYVLCSSIYKGNKYKGVTVVTFCLLVSRLLQKKDFSYIKLSSSKSLIFQVFSILIIKLKILNFVQPCTHNWMKIVGKKGTRNKGKKNNKDSDYFTGHALFEVSIETFLCALIWDRGSPRPQQPPHPPPQRHLYLKKWSKEIINGDWT